jgi:branched-chain amino acid transport system permease protein
VVVVLFFVGSLVEIGLVKPIRRKTNDWVVPTLIATLGLQIALQNSARLVWGASYRGIPGYFSGSIRLGSVTFSLERLVIFGVSVFLLVGTWLFLNRTKLGSGILAVSQDRDSAELVGINTERIYAFTFGLSSLLVGIAGVILLPTLLAYPTVGQAPLLKAFAVALLGGMGNLGGAMLSGFVLGIAESLGVAYLSASMSELIPFIVIIIVLTCYPSGLAGLIAKIKKT